MKTIVASIAAGFTVAVIALNPTPAVAQNDRQRGLEHGGNSQSTLESPLSKTAWLAHKTSHAAPDCRFAVPNQSILKQAN